MSAAKDPSEGLASSSNHVSKIETECFSIVQTNTRQSVGLQGNTADTESKLSIRYVSPMTGTGLPSPDTEAIDVMTKDMRDLVKQIQDLRHLGIEDSKIALPKICVVGSQSAGKSSLIEGMSEIKVPRSAGTCTRCPMEINLSDSDQPWKCSVSLSRTHTYSTKGLRKITKTKPLGPWFEIEPQDEHFTTLKSKDLVQDAIKRAQLAILNPDMNPDDFKPDSTVNIDETFTRVKFSPNVVRLDISAPGFPNLSFYDLPGVISQPEVDEEAYLVSLVENLVKQYVSQENCIILLTLSMTDDAINSTAAAIVREIKATGRTLGVLTKPDRVEDMSQWTDLLSGQKFTLGHGYYVVCNNPDPQVGHRQARLEEDQFFSSGPWTDALAMFRPRLGTRNLQNALSQLLINQIKECLPHVENQIREKVERINTDLQSLPQPFNQNTFYFLCEKLQELKSAISASFEGGSKEFPTLKIWNKIAEDFAMALEFTKPTVQLQTEQEKTKLKIISVDEDYDCQEVQPGQTQKRKSPETELQAKPDPNPAPSYSTDHFRDFKKPAKTFGLLEIRGYNEEYLSRRLPEQMHPKAIEIMNKLSILHWNGPMQIYLDATCKEVKKAIMKQIDSVLQGYENTELFRQVSAISRQFLSQLKLNIESYAAQLLSCEYSQPVVQDMNTIKKEGRLIYNELKKRRMYRTAVSILQMQGQTLPLDRVKAEKVIENMDIGPDQFETELKMMAFSRAHYKVASSRFIDYLYMNIKMQVFKKCKEELFNEIEKQLGVKEEDASSRCAQLMAHDPELQYRREFLVKERGKLEVALQWLDSTGKNKDRSDDDDVDMNQGLFY